MRVLPRVLAPAVAIVFAAVALSHAGPTMNQGLVGFGSTIVAPQGRLTLQSATPVMVTSQTAQTTVYYASYKGGGKVPYWNGAYDALDTIPSNQASTAMRASSTGVLNAAGVFDAWWVVSGAGRICFATNGSGGGWASDTAGSNTARGTGYTKLDGTTRAYTTNFGTITHCYNGTTDYGPIAANRATYLGTVTTDAGAAGSVSWTFGTATSGGGAAIFGVCNYYNDVPVRTLVQDSATTWTYAVAAWRAYDGAGTGSGANNRATYVSCNNEKPVTARLQTNGNTNTTNNTDPGVSIGVDSTTVASGTVTEVSTTATSGMVSEYSGYPGAGLHFLQALEWGNATNAPSFYGANTKNGVPLVEALIFDGTM